jgi:four helix bundle protein
VSRVPKREGGSTVEGRGGKERGEGKWSRYDPERLAVYRRARRHTRAVHELLDRSDTRGYADLVDDLKRCLKSATANIKEGYGEHRPTRKANFYLIAKASVTEAWGHVDSLVDFGIVSSSEIEEIRDLQNQIIALLVTMIRTQESRASR